MRYCPNCGRKISRNIKFCPYCGAHQDKVRTISKTTKSDIVRKVRKPKNKITIMVAVIVILLLCILGWHHWYETSPNAFSGQDLIGHEYTEKGPGLDSTITFSKYNVHEYSLSNRSETTTPIAKYTRHGIINAQGHCRIYVKITSNNDRKRLHVKLVKATYNGQTSVNGHSVLGAALSSSPKQATLIQNK